MTSPKRAVGTAALALLCVPTPAAPGQAPGTGPSFDCAAATTAVETLTCADEGLAALDRRLQQVYTRGVAWWPEEITADERGIHQAWMASRGACADADVDLRACVAGAYVLRIIDVQIRAGLLGAPTTITCEAGQTVTIGFFLDADRPSGLVTVGDERTVVFLAPPLQDDALTPGAAVVTYEGPRALFLESPAGGTLEWDGGTTLACSGVPPTLVVEPEPTPRRRPSRL